MRTALFILIVFSFSSRASQNPCNEFETMLENHFENEGKFLKEIEGNFRDNSQNWARIHNDIVQKRLVVRGPTKNYNGNAKKMANRSLYNLNVVEKHRSNFDSTLTDLIVKFRYCRDGDKN